MPVSQLTGRTTASLSAEVRPQVSGIIQKRLFTEGDMVKAGRPLPDRSSSIARPNEAAAALKQAQALVVSVPEGPALRVAGQDNGVSRRMLTTPPPPAPGQGQRGIKSGAGERAT